MFELAAETTEIVIVCLCELRFNERFLMVLCIAILGVGVTFFFNFVLICGDESEHVLRHVLLKIPILENIKGVAFHLPRTNHWKIEVLSVDITLPVLHWNSEHMLWLAVQSACHA